jgi:hypothetical protein
MGKTHWVRARHAPVRRLLVWDPAGDWTQEHALGGGRITIGEFLERARAGHYNAGVLRLAVRPTWRGKIAEEFELFCRAAFRIGALRAVVEEVSFVASPQSLGPHFLRLIVAGRHRGVSLCVVGQRYAQFPRTCTSQASFICTFRQSENADVEYLRARLGDVADLVPHLEPRHFVTWTPTGGVLINSPL